MAKQKYTKSLNISALCLYHSRGSLVIPEVQRDLVWTTSQKQLLIDSLLKDYDIPKIYFREVEHDGTQQFEVVDGQQRLDAIFGFVADEFALLSDSDPFEGEDVAGKKWSQLSADAQIIFNNRSLDVTYLRDYSDEEMEETFLRLQNGTPLKAPEKRRAIAGNMRTVIASLAKDKVFDYCEFKDVHYAYEDVTAKILKQLMDGGPTTIAAAALRKMYEMNPNITEDDKNAKALKSAFSFLCKAFKNTENPHLKKYALIDLTVIASSMLNVYDLRNYPEEFGNAYLDFSTERILNRELPEDEQDPRLVEYSNAARGDSLGFMKYRQDLLREYILSKMPYLTVKDKNRNFTADQRAVIYRLSGGKCAICGIEVSEEDFEADHKTPWSKGGATQIANGQVLCSACNKKKSDSLLEQ